MNRKPIYGVINVQNVITVGLLLFKIISDPDNKMNKTNLKIKKNTQSHQDTCFHGESPSGNQQLQFNICALI